MTPWDVPPASLSPGGQVALGGQACALALAFLARRRARHGAERTALSAAGAASAVLLASLGLAALCSVETLIKCLGVDLDYPQPFLEARVGPELASSGADAMLGLSAALLPLALLGRPLSLALRHARDPRSALRPLSWRILWQTLAALAAGLCALAVGRELVPVSLGAAGAGIVASAPSTWPRP